MGYPIQLTPSDKRCLVAGGGAIALQKIEQLLAAKMRVLVVAPAIDPAIEALALRDADDALVIERREAHLDDVREKALVIAATDDRAVNAALAAAAAAQNILVNAVDDPQACTFYAPAVVRRGDVSITISTDGGSPLFAAQLRRVLDAALPKSIASIADFFVRARKRGLRGLAQRAKLLRALADPRLVRAVDAGEHDEAADRLAAIAAEREERFEPGSVSIVGAGPGSKALLTLRALDRLQRADVILHDALVDREVLELAPKSTRIIDVGRRCKSIEHRGTSIELAIALLIREAKSGARVVRLHAGDPFVFGRGGEEIDALAAAGIEHEVVPGVSAVLAAPAAAKIPLTRRGEARSFTVRTGHSADDAPAEETIVLLMGLGAAREHLAKLIAGGLDADTPAAAISNATRATERVISGTVSDLADKIEAAALPSPATLVIGKVARRAVATVSSASPVSPAASAGEVAA